MLKINILTILSVSTAFGLTACGGGGGGGGATGPTPFSSWSAVPVNSPVTVSGGGTTFVNGNATQSYNGGASATVTLDGNRNLSAINLSANGITGNFSTANGDVLRTSAAVQEFTSKDGKAVATFISPTALGWDYQTFGVWGGAAGANLSTSSVNSVTLGSVTAVSGIPATGQATFSGLSAGYFVNTSGQLYGVAAPSALAVDFGTRNFGFATSGTVASPAGGGSVVSAPALDMRGAGSYASGTNQLAGTVVTQGGMSGPIIAQFYGPNANEVGGTYAVRSGSIGTMTGGFGGKR